MKTCVFIYGCFFAGILASWGFSLEEAIQVATTNNPDVVAAYEAFQSASAAAFVDRGELYPQVGVVGNARLTEQNFDMETDNETYSIGLRATQHLFAGGRYKHQFQSLYAVADQASNNWAVARNTMVADLAAAYMDVLREREALQLQLQLVKVLEKQLEITQSRNELGEAIRSDVMQAESRLAEAHAHVAQAQAELMIAKTGLRRILGQEVRDRALVWPQVADKIPPSLSNALARASVDNPQTRAADAWVQAMEHQLKMGQARRYPGVDLVAEATQSDQVFAPSEEYYVGVELNFPIFSGAKLKNRVTQYRAERRQAEAERDLVHRNIEEAVIRAWQLYVSAIATRNAFEKTVSAAQQVADSFKEEYKAGERTIVDVLNADQDVLEAQVNVTRARRDMVVAAVQLISAMGTPFADLQIEDEFIEGRPLTKPKAWALGAEAEE